MAVNPLTLAEIQQKCTPAQLAPRNDVAIAAIVNTGRTAVVSNLCGYGAVLEALGPTNGAALLDSLNAQAASNSVVKYALQLLDKDKLDFGLPSTRQTIQTLITDPTAQAALLGLGQAPDPVDVGEVSDILNLAGM